MPLRIGSDVPFTSTSPGEAFTDSSLDGDPIRVHKRLGGPVCVATRQLPSHGGGSAVGIVLVLQLLRQWRQVKGSGCRCLSESELMRNKSFVGDLVDAPLPISKVPEPLEDEPVKQSYGCASRRFCLMDVSWQVVWTSGTKGRMCLRKGNMGMKSLGCWSPSNLQKLE
ncbi:hypothetical protein AK812_SmicGene26107 [Symbiodinium microadriaticum]|uniref:Uncharacterized protein n=1 Tax=Symbiodinium microadriaticum TaxID=2951 RepID=A0A1Q9DA88_SYMMI|nr:hypothetical protein AK812_SmicGene26107 [Symbiodinium microadriaticum]CAE7452907.1 unnamed protein product [Symbiodinium microadriaticum]CAE7751104.1 unnamed protein product [Symbiodinium sp. KB8]